MEIGFVLVKRVIGEQKIAFSRERVGEISKTPKKTSG